MPAKTLKVTFSRTDDALGDALREQINNLSKTYRNSEVVTAFGTKPGASTLYATLVLHGAFRYWWYQEFGVGKFFEYNNNAPLRTPQGVLPPFLGGLQATTIDPNAVNPRTGDYLISEASRRNLKKKQYNTEGRYIIRKRGAGDLAYFSKEGDLRFAPFVWHPGFKAWQAPDQGTTAGQFFGSGDPAWGQGLIRVTLSQMRKNMARRFNELGKRIEREAMKKWATKRKFDLRAEILFIINDEMRKAVDKLKRYTPRADTSLVIPGGHSDHPDGHLADAWAFDPAQ